ncbi:MAG TPA: NADH-quinone oxidoreductase subunit J [Thermoanaerobaculia bacterium]|nr:NADH-quinone oxidoreductase subunit J [Thermoanaerobaculia bacterium]
MDQVLSAVPMLVFFILGTVAVGSSILVVAMRSPVHSALFLLLTFICVAALFILAHAEFVGAVQLLVYAGGIMVLFLFVVMLANVRDVPGTRMISPYWKGGVGVGIALFLIFASILRSGAYADPARSTDPLREHEVTRMRPVATPQGTEQRPVLVIDVQGNTEAIGMELYTKYLVPFEVASLFLLVAMIGAIVIGKRNLAALEEETVPPFIAERAATEKREKEAIGA